MKYTLAVAALLGHTNALPAYSDASDIGAGFTSGSKVDGGADSQICHSIMRGQATSVWHLHS